VLLVAWSTFLAPVSPLWQPLRWLQKRLNDGNQCVSEESVSDDLSADGPIARRIRAELAAYKPLPDSRFRCVHTGSGRGFGLYVGELTIESGEYLFDYQGRTREDAEHTALYPEDTGRSNYSVGILRSDGSTVFVDGTDPAESNLARYMNHADADADGCNVVAWTLAEPQPRVLLFASRALLPGEEMSWDYGSAFWAGREDEQLRY